MQLILGFLLCVNIGLTLSESKLQIQHEIPSRTQINEFSSAATEIVSKLPDNETFCFFAYDRNMFYPAFKQKYPEAQRITNGKLKNARLDFSPYDDNYLGSKVAACAQCGSEIYGMLYLLQNSAIRKLQKEYDVVIGEKELVVGDIETDDYGLINCVVLAEKNCPPLLFYGLSFPPDRRPSKTYQEELLKAAYDANLPDSYISGLSSLPNNEQIYQSVF